MKASANDLLAQARRGDAAAVKALSRDKSAPATAALGAIVREGKGFEVRSEALFALDKRRDDSRALDALLAAAKDPKTASAENYGERAVESIARCRSTRTVGLLVLLAASPAPKVKLAAVRHLSDRVQRDKAVRGDKKVASALARALKDPKCRYFAVTGLRLCPDPRALKALGVCASDKSVDVRLAAYQALAAIGGPQALAILEARAERATKSERSWSLDKLIARLGG